MERNISCFCWTVSGLVCCNTIWPKALSELALNFQVHRHILTDNANRYQTLIENRKFKLLGAQFLPEMHSSYNSLNLLHCWQTVSILNVLRNVLFVFTAKFVPNYILHLMFWNRHNYHSTHSSCFKSVVLVKRCFRVYEIDSLQFL